MRGEALLRQAEERLKEFESLMIEYHKGYDRDRPIPRESEPMSDLEIECRVSRLIAIPREYVLCKQSKNSGIVWRHRFDASQKLRHLNAEKGGE